MRRVCNSTADRSYWGTFNIYAEEAKLGVLETADAPDSVL